MRDVKKLNQIGNSPIFSADSIYCNTGTRRQIKFTVMLFAKIAVADQCFLFASVSLLRQKRNAYNLLRQKRNAYNLLGDIIMVRQIYKFLDDQSIKSGEGKIFDISGKSEVTDSPSGGVITVIEFSEING